LADARAGKPPYFCALLSHPDQREEMIKDGWKSISRVFILALVLDVVYQIIEVGFVYPREAIIVAFILAILPYLILRGLVTRLTQKRGAESHDRQRLRLRKTTSMPASPDFSLVSGGPLFQLCRRTHLTGDGWDHPYRRVVVITLFAWLPLLVLSLIEGRALGENTQISFLRDIEAHVRFLIALPVLLSAELVVHIRLGPVVRQLLERNIVVPEDRPKFSAAIASALRVRDSVAMETGLLILAYTFGDWLWRSQLALRSATWYAMPDAKGLHLTEAGYWYAFASIPIFQFILLRWYMRLALWFWLLWKFSKLNLHLDAAHPDRAGGIGFLGTSSHAFTPILFAQGSILAGLIASRVLLQGQNLLSFKMQIAGFVVFFVLVILGPLVTFTPLMVRAKRVGRAEYGLLASRYVFAFRKRWVQNGASDTGGLLAEDIQGLADLGNSYSVVRGMRIVPFALEDVTLLAVTTALPLLPLVLTKFSLEELLVGLIKLLFR